MTIKLGGDTNITLTNTSFSCSTGGGDPAMIVSLFTVASAGNYRFEGNFTGNSAMTVALSINGTNKEMWIVIGTQNGTYDFTAEVGDVITLEAAGSGSGSNLSVVRYADEIKEIYVGEGTLVDDYSAMRGPCPSGYHVPLDTERASVVAVGVSLGVWATSDGNSMFLALKMPKSHYLRSASGTPNTSYSYTYYHSVKNSASVCSALYSYKGGNISTSSNSNKSEGHHIRPFKDNPVIPDSSWTKLYSGTGNAGIYHNSTLGLISLSSDGTTRITIADRNLGATTVYNDGDILGQDNCGNFYQYGNNYGFPFTGATKTSSTKPDTTGYGPGNYYSSDTFITVSSGNWEQTNSTNLRGYTTGVQQKQAGNVTEVYVGTTKVRPLTN